MNGPRLRVGFLSSAWAPQVGGIPVVTRNLAAELGARGHRVFALCFDGESGGSSEPLSEGVVLRIRSGDRQTRARDSMLRRADLEREVLAWCVDHGLDLVHIHSLDGWGLGVPERLRELGVPTLWTWHDYWPLCPRGQMWHVEDRACESVDSQTCGDCVESCWPETIDAGCGEAFIRERVALLRGALESTTRLLCPSRGMRGFLDAQELGVEFGVVENGVCEQRRINDGVPAPGDSIRVGVLGSVQPSKGVLMLAEVIAELGAPFEMQVHGPCEPYHGDTRTLDDLRALAEQSEALSLFEAFEPAQRSRLLANLDLVAVPSLWQESFGLVAREAAAAGVPVFASRVGGLADGPFHHLPAGDAQAWKRALCRFAEEPAWRAALAGAAHATPSVSAMACDYLREYEALLAR